MPESSAANLELAILLPLGVVANQLMRIEADLRVLNMKALACTGEDGHAGMAGRISARLEGINETLDLIRGLTTDMEADMRHGSARRTSSRDRDD